MSNQTFDINAAMAQINQVHAQQEEQAKFVDERFVYSKAGHNYSFRLLWSADAAGQRKLPIIFKLTHECGVGSDRDIVTCPTSDYISGNAGFRQCDICTEANRLYNDWKDTKNQTTRDLYTKFKRQYRYTALVYVVKDDLKPENVGKIMLFRMPKGIADQIKKEVFGWTIKKDDIPLPQDQLIQGAAFSLTDGYNLNVSITSKKTEEGTFNNYTAQFSRNKSAIQVTQEAVNQASIDLKFDVDFYTPFIKEDTDAFVSKHILQSKMDAELSGAQTGFTNPNVTEAVSTLGEDNNNPELDAVKVEPKNDTDKEIDDLLAGIQQPTV